MERPRGLGPCDLLTADELAKYTHRRREVAVDWAERHGIGVSLDDGPLLYPAGEVLQALRDDRDRARRPAAPPAPVPSLQLAPVSPHRGGPRRGPRP